MSPNDIYNQGYYSAIKELGTISELCPFHYSTNQFKIWCNGYYRGVDELKARKKNAALSNLRACL